jgi:hypothetical protein
MRQCNLLLLRCLWRAGLLQGFCLLAFERGICGFPLACESVCESEVSSSVAGIGSNGCLKLLYRFGDLTFLQQHVAAIECEVSALAVDGDTAEIGALFALRYGAGGVMLF